MTTSTLATTKPPQDSGNGGSGNGGSGSERGASPQEGGDAPERAKTVFNSDLLLSQVDRDHARAAYGDVYFALDNEAVREAFAPVDARANAAKTRSRQWGVFAVFMAMGALLLAGGEMLYHDLPKLQIRMIAALGGILGIASVAIGLFGVMFKERKMRWLHDRLLTERIRQHHFRAYIEEAPAILASVSDNNKQQVFQARREQDFQAFLTRIAPTLEDDLHGIVHSDRRGDTIDPPRPPAIDADLSDHRSLDPYFAAYRRLRFEHQIGYCDYILREKNGFWKQAPVRQRRVLGAIALACVLGILILHALVFLGALANIAWMKSPFVHVLAIWAAIIALTAKAFEEGFQPEREIERMRHYRYSLRRLLDRFDAAETPGEKLKAMSDLERLSQEEMSLFLKGNYEAEFVM